MRHRKSKKDGKQVLETKKTHMKQTLTLVMRGDEFHVLLTTMRCLYCTSAGHVTIEVSELSDGGEENKKAAGPGWFCFKKIVL